MPCGLQSRCQGEWSFSRKGCMRNKHTASGCYRFDSREHERTTKIMKTKYYSHSSCPPRTQETCPFLVSEASATRTRRQLQPERIADWRNGLIEEHNDIQIQPQETDNSDRATVFRLASEHNKVQGSWPRVIQSNGTGHSLLGQLCSAIMLKPSRRKLGY